MFNFNSLANAERALAERRAKQGETKAEFLQRAQREALARDAGQREANQGPGQGPGSDPWAFENQRLQKAYPWFRLTGRLTLTPQAA